MRGPGFYLSFPVLSSVVVDRRLVGGGANCIRMCLIQNNFLQYRTLTSKSLVRVGLLIKPKNMEFYVDVNFEFC